MSVIHSPPKVDNDVVDDAEHDVSIDDASDDIPDDYTDDMQKYDELQQLLKSFRPTEQPGTRKGPERTARPANSTSSTKRKGIDNKLNAILDAVEFICGEMRDLRSDVRESNEKYSALASRVENLESKIESQHDECANRVSNIEERVQSLETREGASVNNALEDRIDELEQKSLNSKAILTLSHPLAIDATHSADRTQLVKDHLSSTLSLPIEDLKISAHSFDSEGYTPGCRFVVDFNDPTTRPMIFKKFRQIRPRGQFLNDFLTKKRNNTLYEIRKLRDEGTNSEKIKKVFSDYGRLFVVMDGSTRPKLVRTVADVRALL